MQNFEITPDNFWGRNTLQQRNQITSRILYTGSLFYLTTIGCHFLSACLSYKHVPLPHRGVVAAEVTNDGSQNNRGPVFRFADLVRVFVIIYTKAYLDNDALIVSARSSVQI
jgi:hypothetical protein